MACLFVNACLREGSRTLRLARRLLETVDGEVEEVDLARAKVGPLDAESLPAYNAGVAAHDFSDPLFDAARRFAAADEIVIAAPYWNHGIPALLHDYLELACSQGVTFDIMADGSYVALCRARRLTYVTTAGGPLAPENDHAFPYVRTLCREFWGIGDVRLVAAEMLDVVGTDVEAALDAAL